MPPATFVADKFNVEPAQTGPLLDAVVEGIGFTVTVTLPVIFAVQPEPVVATTV